MVQAQLQHDVVQAQLRAISEQLEAQSQNRLPLPEPGTFSGDPLHFETLIESRTLSPVERLHFLGKYVTGRTMELNEGCMLLDSEDAYQKAKGILSK